jgi:hypothetical protein
MNIGEFIEAIKQLCLDHKQIVSFQVGNTYDIATSKSSERYPACWLELPILINYDDSRRKTYQLSLNFLSLAKSDDVTDQIYRTSEMESIADEMLQVMTDKFKNIGLSNSTSLTLRNFSDDDCAGVRVDISFIVGRECDPKKSFNQGF